MKFLGGCPPIKLTKIIADMKWIQYDYLRRFMIVNPKNQKEVNHENLSSCKNEIVFFPEKWPAGCGGTPGKIVRTRMIKSFQFRMKLPG